MLGGGGGGGGVRIYSGKDNVIHRLTLNNKITGGNGKKC